MLIPVVIFRHEGVRHPTEWWLCGGSGDICWCSHWPVASAYSSELLASGTASSCLYSRFLPSSRQLCSEEWVLLRPAHFCYSSWTLVWASCLLNSLLLYPSYAHHQNDISVLESTSFLTVTQSKISNLTISPVFKNLFCHLLKWLNTWCVKQRSCRAHWYPQWPLCICEPNYRTAKSPSRKSAALSG